MELRVTFPALACCDDEVHTLMCLDVKFTYFRRYYTRLRELYLVLLHLGVEQRMAHTKYSGLTCRTQTREQDRALKWHENYTATKRLVAQR